MITELEVGKTYVARCQGVFITPINLNVEVVWDDGENIHYRLEGQTLVKQTSKERFLEIINDQAKRSDFKKKDTYL